MKRAADFRAIARHALKGRWGIAVLAGLLASLLGVNMSVLNLNFNFEVSGGDSGTQTAQGIDPELMGLIVGIFTAALLVALLFCLIGSIVKPGYARFNLNLVDHTDVKTGMLFGHFRRWKTAVATELLKAVFTTLWSLLLIVPGIIASYSYAMTHYILAENPEMGAREAIALSKSYMKGNRWRLFCLHISFIGWNILCAFTLGIGGLWLTPYEQAAEAAFYREVSGTEASGIIAELQEPEGADENWE